MWGDSIGLGIELHGGDARITGLLPAALIASMLVPVCPAPAVTRTTSLDRFNLPTAGVRRSRAPIPQWRHEILMDYADTVDPTGRFSSTWSSLAGRPPDQDYPAHGAQGYPGDRSRDLCSPGRLAVQLRRASRPGCGGEAVRGEWRGDTRPLLLHQVRAERAGGLGRAVRRRLPRCPVVMDEWRRYRDRYWNELRTEMTGAR